MENIIRIRRGKTQINSLKDFLEIKSCINQGVKEVYFVRLLGTNTTLSSDIRQIESHMALRMSEEQDFLYHRVVRLPVLSSPADIAYYGACYGTWVSGQKESVSSRAVGDHAVYNRLLGSALKQVSGLYAAGRKQISESMEKNFIAKMLFWHDSLLCGVLNHWNERLTAKLALSDLVLEQEYLFACLLTLLGYDVLLLQSKADISEKLDSLGMSQKIILGEFANPALPAFDREELMLSAKRHMPAGQGKASAGPSGPATIKLPPRPGAASKEPSDAAAPCGPVTVKLPPRPRQTAKYPDTAAGSADSGSSHPIAIKIPPHPGRDARKGGPVSAVHTVAKSSARAPEGTKTALSSRPVTARKAAGKDALPAEKSFEELALLASSVVMIAIHGSNGDIIGTGSGIMVGKDGYILTNNHVACGGRYYSVRIEDDETVYTTDELIKYHSTLDLAILRIDRRLTPLSIYKGKDPLVRGQKVVAIGSPLGLFNSVSDGIISGFRKIDGVDMIQFTAPTSHGSSGGAVLNMYGEVIGISTAGFDAGQNINLAMGYECISRFISGFV